MSLRSKSRATDGGGGRGDDNCGSPGKKKHTPNSGGGGGGGGGEGGDRPPPDLLSVLRNVDLRRKILPLLDDAEDLCALDLSCREFRAYTEPEWNRVVMAKFSLPGGKAGYRTVASLMRRPVFFPLAQGRHLHPAFSRDHQPMVANNGTFVATADYYDADTSIIALRDAKTLNFIRTDPVPMPVFYFAVCGSEGAEIYVTSNATTLRAHHVNGDRMQVVDFTYIPRRGGIVILGRDSHLIAFHDEQIHVYQTGLVGPLLLTFIHSLPFRYESDWKGPSPFWTAEPNRFAAISNDQAICVWELDPQTSLAAQVQRVRTGFEDVAGFAVGRSYVAVGCGEWKLHFFDYDTGGRIHRDLFDADEAGQYMPAGRMVMETVGDSDLLVTTSYLCDGLCVWNMRTGQLLKKHDATSVDEPYGMVRLKIPSPAGSFAFVTMMDEVQCVWGFPGNKDSTRWLRKIQSREEFFAAALQQLVDVDDEEEDDDEESDSDGND